MPVERIAVIPQLDEHSVATEDGDETLELALPRPRTIAHERGGTAPLRQPVITNQWSLPVPAQPWRRAQRLRRGKGGTKWRGTPFSPRSCASLIARARHACPTGPSASTTRCSPGGRDPARGRAGVEGQLGTEHGRQLERSGRFREADDPVEAVVIGDAEPGETEPVGLLHQLLGVAGPVEEGEVGVAVQLGVLGAAHVGHRIEHVFGTATGPVTTIR